MKDWCVRELPKTHPSRSSFDDVMSSDYGIFLKEQGVYDTSQKKLVCFGISMIRVG